MELKKQDRNGVRTAQDLQRRINYEGQERRILKLEKETVLDSSLSNTSSFGVQNKVVTKEIAKKLDIDSLIEITTEEIDQLFEEGGNDG